MSDNYSPSKSPPPIAPEIDNGPQDDGHHDGVSRRSFLGRFALAGAALAAPTVSALAEPATAHAGAIAAPSVAAAEAQAAMVGATSRVPVTLKINGQDHSLRLEPRTTLLDALRENLHLTGSKKGCNHGQCGACTVLVNGKRSLSCLTLALAVEGDAITTIEGLSVGEALHPVQAAFLENDAFQCGYCTSGQICSAVGMLGEVDADHPSHVTLDVRTKVSRATLSDDEIRERMSGNLCRCGAYANIVAAVKEVAEGKTA